MIPSPQVKTYAQDGHVIIAVDDGKVNAITPSLAKELNSALDNLPDDLSVLIIKGNERAFCVGFDLAIIQGSDDKTRSLLISDAWRFWLRLYNFPRPVIAAVTGHALGFGAYLTLAFDKVIAAEGEYGMGFTEVGLGIALDQPPFLTPILQRIPPQYQQSVILHSEIYRPDAAIKAGLCHEVVPAESLLAKCHEAASKLGRLPNPAYAQTKKVLHAECAKGIEQALMI